MISDILPVSLKRFSSDTGHTTICLALLKKNKPNPIETAHRLCLEALQV